MEPEISSLLDTLKLYKKAVIHNLNNIEENVVQAVNTYENTHTISSFTRKFQISMEMSKVLQLHMRMLFTCEKLNEEIRSKFADLERSAQPEKERSNCNPFLVTTSEEVVVVKNEDKSVELCSENSLLDIIPQSLPNSDNSPVTMLGHSDFIQQDGVDLNIESPKASGSIKLEIQPLPHKDSNDFSNSDHTSLKNDEMKQNLSQNPSFLEDTPLNLQDTKEVLPRGKSSKKPTKSSLKHSSPTIRDRKEEASKLLENKKLKKQLRWNIEPVVTQITPKPEKTKPIVTEIQESPLKVGQTCVICHIDSPSEFYVHTEFELFEEFEARINDDMDKDHQYVVNNYKTKKEARDRLGNFCFIYLSKRQKWFRLEVLDWMMNEVELVIIQLIDYGETLECSYKNLKMMTDVYGLFSRMAIKCQLAGIYSPSADQTKRWPQTSVNFFIQLAEIPKKTQFMTIYVHPEGHINLVELRKLSDSNGPCLGELMVKNNHAFQVRISAKDFFEKFDQEDLDEFDNINEAISGYDAQDEARICPFTRKSGGCFKGPSCKLEHTKLSKDGVTTDKVLVLSESLTKLELPAAEEYIQVLITGYVNTCHFYAHVLKSQSEDGVFNDVFERLVETMKTNNVVQSYESFKVNPGIGELMLVKMDQEWHRGRCIGYGTQQEVEVFLVDFGYSVVKKIKDLRQMNEDFLYVPFQAIECILHDCQEKRGLSSLSREFFDSVMNMKIFKGKVVESGEPLRLYLWDPDDIIMSHILQQWGLVEERKQSIYPEKDSVVVCS